MSSSVENVTFVQKLYLPYLESVFLLTKMTDDLPSRKRLSSTHCDDLENSFIQCSICLESWTSDGRHRLVSLLCGHLFGKSCIDHWLKSHDKCPSCNAPARAKDVHPIFCMKTLAVEDTSECEAMRRQWHEEKKKRLEAEKCAAQARLQCALLEKEKQKLLEQMDSFTHKNATKSQVSVVSHDLFSVVYKRQVDLHDSQARYVTFAQESHQFLATRANINPTHSFGYTKISLMDPTTPLRAVGCHFKPIRDLTYQAGRILSAGMDKRLVLGTLSGETMICTWQQETHPFWSCAFDKVANDSIPATFVYAGLANGTVLTFDIRQPKEAVQCVSLGTRALPVHSLKQIGNDFMAATYDGCYYIPRQALHESNDSQPEWRRLESSEGAVCTNLSTIISDDSKDTFESSFLATFRHKNNQGHATLGHYDSMNNQFQEETTIPLSRHCLLTRSFLYKRQESLFALLGQEELPGFSIYKKGQETPLQTCPTGGLPCLDLMICPTNGGLREHLVCLTQKQLLFYQLA